MNFWEQFALGFVLTLLHALKLDPARVPALQTVLLDIYDGIGEVLSLPPREAPATAAPAAPPAPPASILP